MLGRLPAIMGDDAADPALCLRAKA